MATDEPDRPADEAEPGGLATEPAADEPTDEPAADELATGAPTRPELRAKDLIGRTREEVEEQLDPRTMAELASWFSRPSRVEVEESLEALQRPRLDELDAIAKLGMAMGMMTLEESAAQKEARANALAAVEPAMIALLERHNHTPERLLQPLPEVALHIDESVVPAWIRAQLSTDDDEGPRIGEPRLLHRSPDIDKLLDDDNAPQAVLRDLHRPEQSFDRTFQPAFPPPPEEEDMTHALRDALRWRPEPLPARERPIDPRDEWRALYTGSWAEMVPAARDLRQAEADAAAADDPGFGMFFFGRR